MPPLAELEPDMAGDEVECEEPVDDIILAFFKAADSIVNEN